MREYMTEQEVEKRFDEFLDENYPEYKIGELSFTASEILKNCDPIAYREALLDWADANGIEIE
jgi:hypothetical protein